MESRGVNWVSEVNEAGIYYVVSQPHILAFPLLGESHSSKACADGSIIKFCFLFKYVFLGAVLKYGCKFSLLPRNCIF
jgi:hypothetical protein